MEHGAVAFGNGFIDRVHSVPSTNEEVPPNVCLRIAINCNNDVIITSAEILTDEIIVISKTIESVGLTLDRGPTTFIPLG